MSVYQIITIPDNALRVKANPVRSINAGVLRVIDNMIDTMYAYDGIGLAATQIGINKRIIVLDSGEDGLMTVINPEIIHREGMVTATEGCLSVPEADGVVTRAEKITVKGLDRDGQEVVYEAEGVLARIFQHEVDHLNGVLFVDVAESLRKKE